MRYSPPPVYLPATPQREAFKRSPVDPKGGLQHVGPMAATVDRRFANSTSVRAGYYPGEKDLERGLTEKRFYAPKPGSILRGAMRGSSSNTATMHGHIVTTQSGFLG